MHFLRVIVCCAGLFGSAFHAQAQLTPWWQEPVTDSSEAQQQALADSVIGYAKSFIGVPYVWGGSDPSTGFDCSGFICYVFKAFNIELPRTSGDQFDAGIPVPYVQAAPGDIILFSGPNDGPGDPGHVGIVIAYDADNGFSFIHTSSPETGGVRISHEKHEQYYSERFLEVRRVININ